MKIEIRADGAHIFGYVNATEKKSRPVMTPHGLVIEEIEPRAFEHALSRAENVTMTKDHSPDFVLAQTKDGTLSLYEDAIGLHAEAVVTDPETISELRGGKAKGWSFGMYHVLDELEQRENALPLRKVKSLDLDHVSLIVRKNPAYSATSIEVRAEGEIETELRSIEDAPQVKAELEDPNAEYRTRARKMQLEGFRQRARLIRCPP